MFVASFNHALQLNIPLVFIFTLGRLVAKRPFLRGLFLEGLIYGGIFAF